MLDIITNIFCKIDDYCQETETNWINTLKSQNKIQRKRSNIISLSEIMTISIIFHASQYRNFKYFYLHHVSIFLAKEFPKLPSYSRMCELMQRIKEPLIGFFNSIKGENTGLTIIDSTPIKVCHNRRIYSHKVFKDNATRGVSSTGFFYGFKLHLTINHKSEIMSVELTTAQIDDRKPVNKLCKNISGYLYADKGYISTKLKNSLLEIKNIHLITKGRKNMKNHVISTTNRAFLKKRGVIETVIGQLKEISQIEHTRHRSFSNFIINILSGVVAYCLKDKKPSMNVEFCV